MSKLTSFPGAFLLGAGLMYFLDPVRGRKRRARVGEAAQHAARVERQLLDKAARDAKQRLHGFTERVKHPPSPDVPDAVIAERVRSHLGRAVSHPRALDVVVHDGRVILRGPVFTLEANDLLRSVRKVPGVREVVDRLERHDTAGSISALQGEGRVRRTSEIWSPTLQVGATGAGVLMIAYGLLVRRGVLGMLLGAGGTALALRGTLNKPVPALFGIGEQGKRAVTVQKTITVNRPIHVVFDLWSRPENFPLFMEHVRDVDVEVGGRKSRWVVDGPAGTKLEFEAETTELEPDKRIAWRTLPGQSVEHEGQVRFEEIPGGTRVHVQMSYRPTGGVIGHALMHVLGWDPKARMDDDLVRMKALLEEGKTRAHNERIELADLH